MRSAFLLLLLDSPTIGDPCADLAESALRTVPGRGRWVNQGGPDAGSICGKEGVCSGITWVGPEASLITCEEAEAIMGDVVLLEKLNARTLRGEAALEFLCDVPRSRRNCGAFVDGVELEVGALLMRDTLSNTLPVHWVFNLDAPSLKPASWLASFANYRLTHLPVIPGSRDSKSLSVGVRYLELPLKTSWLTSSVLLASGARLKHALADVTAFLTAHPSEFVIVSLTSAGAWIRANRLRAALKTIENFILEESPNAYTVREAAGKIVLMVDSSLHEKLLKDRRTENFLRIPDHLRPCSSKDDWRCFNTYVSRAGWERFGQVTVKKSETVKFFKLWESLWVTRRSRPVGVVVLEIPDLAARIKTLLQYAQQYRLGSFAVSNERPRMAFQTIKKTLTKKKKTASLPTLDEYLAGAVPRSVIQPIHLEMSVRDRSYMVQVSTHTSS